MTASQTTRPAQVYFDNAAQNYDQVFTNTLIGRAERGAIWQELDQVFHSGQKILELNCGTGVDAVHLAERGVRVLACDIAPRMIEIARQRLSSNKFAELVDFRVLATEDIGELGDDGPFDGAFSNFSGLNCVEDLPAVARNLAQLVRPGSLVLLSMIGRLVPWEIAWFLAHRNPRKAVRRFVRSADGLNSNPMIKVHYPSVGAMARIFAPEFRLREWKGVGVTVPPSYLELWAQRFPKVLSLLARGDRWLGRLPVLRGMADQVLLQFERVER